MSGKRRLKKVEKQLAGLIKSVSRLERGKRKPSHRSAEIPASRASSAKAADTFKTGTARPAAGRHSTKAGGATRKRVPRTPKATSKRARRSGGDVLSTLPS
jgi:hypothetical protein